MLCLFNQINAHYFSVGGCNIKKKPKIKLHYFKDIKYMHHYWKHTDP